MAKSPRQHPIALTTRSCTPFAPQIPPPRRQRGNSWPGAEEACAADYAPATWSRGSSGKPSQWWRILNLPKLGTSASDGPGAKASARGFALQRSLCQMSQSGGEFMGEIDTILPSPQVSFYIEQIKVR